MELTFLKGRKKPVQKQLQGEAVGASSTDNVLQEKITTLGGKGAMEEH